MAKSITITKDGERISFSRDLSAVLDTLRNGRYTLIIEKEKEPRSIEQNALMWLWFTCISRETGTPKQDVHDYYCTAFLRKTVQWNGSDRSVVLGTSSLSKEEFSIFLDSVKADAASEFGIRLPLPEDICFTDFYETYK